MIRQIKAIEPAMWLACVLVLPGCATMDPDRAGEPTPVSEDMTISEAPAEAPAEEAPAVESATAPATESATEPATESATESAAAAPQAPAGSPPPAGPSQFVPSDKPRIVAKVETVQFPAWIERGGIRAGIKAGWAIFTSDRIVTGNDGRVQLGLPGAGRLRIAGNTELVMTDAYELISGAPPPLFRLNRGAFRMSAPVVKLSEEGTPVALRDSLVANVLGGEVFGKSDADEDLLALIDGAAQVSGPKLNPGTMRKPQTYLRVPRAGRAQPVGEIASDRLARWLAPVEPVAGQPTLDAAGTWDVSLNSGYNLRQLESLACRIQERGYPSEVYPVREPGKQVWYRVVVRRFKSKNDAVVFLGTARKLGSREPWVLLPAT